VKTLSSSKSFGGVQHVCEIASRELQCATQFSVYVPPGRGPFPVFWWLSGLTCTQENFTTKAGAQRAASELGLIVVAPDTSPRGEGVPDDPAFDLGQGAGFYVDATAEPWSAHYRMYSFVTQELPRVIAANFPADMGRQGISGHSMGGHGALVIGLRNPQTYRSVTAFAPISDPTECPWGRKALTAYFGDEDSHLEQWRAHSAVSLIDDGAEGEILVDQGTADPFLAEQLMPELLQTAAAETTRKLKLTLRMQEGYDHSYYFVASFIEDHLRWHAKRLR
jgi:S-formylglutathione hydrolase